MDSTKWSNFKCNNTVARALQAVRAIYKQAYRGTTSLKLGIISFFYRSEIAHTCVFSKQLVEQASQVCGQARYQRTAEWSVQSSSLQLVKQVDKEHISEWCYKSKEKEKRSENIRGEVEKGKEMWDEGKARGDGHFVLIMWANIFCRMAKDIWKYWIAWVLICFNLLRSLITHTDIL